MYEKGITPIIRDISNNILLYTGREGTPTFIPHSIQPVANIQTIGRVDKLFAQHSAAVGSTGNKPVFTIPDNEFWTVHLAVFSVSTGTWTMNAIYALLQSPHNIDTNESTDIDKWRYSQTRVIYPVYDQTGGLVFLIWDTSKKSLRLPPRTIIGAVVDGYTSSGTMYGDLLVSREVY